MEVTEWNSSKFAACSEVSTFEMHVQIWVILLSENMVPKTAYFCMVLWLCRDFNVNVFGTKWAIDKQKN